MKRELESLLKIWDEFIQTPNGPEAGRLYALYQAQLDEVARTSKVSKEALHRSVKRYHQRWVRANLPPEFPTNLGLK
jgi:predicted DNA-binding protein YlxM (UPF0122 family)